MQRARGAYFVNRHDTFWKELNFNFPEHQKILKFIKKSLRKSKNCEKFSKIFMFFSKIWKFSIFFEKINWKSYWKKSRFSKIFEISKKISKFRKFFRFFRFSQWFFNEFQKILMFWKVEVLLFPKSTISIYEICSPSSLHGCFWKTC